MRALILNWGIRLGQKQVEQKGMKQGYVRLEIRSAGFPRRLIDFPATDGRAVPSHAQAKSDRIA